MGFFGDIVDDLFDVTEKVVRSPGRVICMVGDHDWEWDKVRERYQCATCKATEYSRK